jgi:hypothetical protein
MPRPTKITVRNHWLSIRLTTLERLRLMAKANKACLTVSEYLRLSALGSRRKAARIVRIIEAPVWPADVYHEVRRIGVNLNQIVRQMNTFPERGTPSGLEEALTSIRDCLACVRDCYGPPRR